MVFTEIYNSTCALHLEAAIFETKNFDHYGNDGTRTMSLVGSADSIVKVSQNALFFRSYFHVLVCLTIKINSSCLNAFNFMEQRVSFNEIYSIMLILEEVLGKNATGSLVSPVAFLAVFNVTRRGYTALVFLSTWRPKSV